MQQEGSFSVQHKDLLEDRLACLYIDLYQCCGVMSVSSMEDLCRRIHITELKICQSRGTKYLREIIRSIHMYEIINFYTNRSVTYGKEYQQDRKREQ